MNLNVKKNLENAVIIVHLLKLILKVLFLMLTVLVYPQSQVDVILRTKEDVLLFKINATVLKELLVLIIFLMII